MPGTRIALQAASIVIQVGRLLGRRGCLSVCPSPSSRITTHPVLQFSSKCYCAFKVPRHRVEHCNLHRPGLCEPHSNCELRRFKFLRLWISFLREVRQSFDAFGITSLLKYYSVRRPRLTRLCVYNWIECCLACIVCIDMALFRYYP